MATKSKSYKFEDCAYCKYRKQPDVCEDCDCGEQFEEEDEDDGLDFDKQDQRIAA